MASSKARRPISPCSGARFVERPEARRRIDLGQSDAGTGDARRGQANGHSTTDRAARHEHRRRGGLEPPGAGPSARGKTASGIDDAVGDERRSQGLPRRERRSNAARAGCGELVERAMGGALTRTIGAACKMGELRRRRRLVGQRREAFRRQV